MSPAAFIWIFFCYINSRLWVWKKKAFQREYFITSFNFDQPSSSLRASERDGMCCRHRVGLFVYTWAVIVSWSAVGLFVVGLSCYETSSDASVCVRDLILFHPIKRGWLWKTVVSFVLCNSLTKWDAHTYCFNTRYNTCHKILIRWYFLNATRWSNDDTHTHTLLSSLLSRLCNVIQLLLPAGFTWNEMKWLSITLRSRLRFTLFHYNQFL